MPEQYPSFVTPDTFEVVWATHQPRLVSFAGRAAIAGGDRSAEDTVQEAACAIWERVNNPDLPPLHTTDNGFISYALRTVYRKGVDAHRKDLVRPQTSALTNDEGYTTDLPDPAPTPEDDIAIKDIWDIVGAELGADEKTMILQLHTEGYSYKEIAEKCGRPVGTLKSNVFYIRETLAAAAEAGRFSGYR